MALPSIDLAAILDAMLEGFQVLGPGLRYLHLNDTAARHGKTTKEALIGRTMAECYPGVEGSPLHATLLRCLEERTSAVIDNEFVFPDGSTGHFELRVEPVPQGICVLSIDVTGRKRAEVELALAEERVRHAQRMDAVGQLAAGIAHDFNNLLSVLVGHAELARARPDGPTRADVEAVLEAAYASASLTRQLLAYGRGAVVARAAIDLADVVGALEPILRRTLGERIELVIEAPAGLGWVDGDPTQLQQVVMNLVLNARDAIEGRGRIAIELATTELDEAALALHPGARAGRHAVISVVDTGKGMDAATRARVFEPFFTTKERERGTGLGLATVYGLVRQHGGSVWVYSEPGAGSTFKVYLPLVESREASPPQPRAVERPTRAPGPVLVAEDSALLRALVEAVLTGGGYRVVLATTGPQALELFERDPAIALLITDVMMPGMNGPELVDRVRERRPSLPIICSSGYSDRHLVARGQLPTGVVFMQKPFTPQALLDEVCTRIGPPAPK